MRIVAWNCAQKLDVKYEPLMSLQPDIAVIPECAEPDVLRKKAPDFAFSDCEWQGELRNKGLGVFAFGKRSLRRHQLWERRFHLFLPIEVRGVDSWNLLAAWAFNQRTPISVAPKQTNSAQAIEYYASFLKGGRSIAAGDFNNNILWEKTTRNHKFLPMNDALGHLGLVSAYHAVTTERFGEETRATHWFQRNPNKTYHIDFVFVPRASTTSGLRLQIGALEPWCKLSDHAPVIVDLSD